MAAECLGELLFRKRSPDYPQGIGIERVTTLEEGVDERAMSEFLAFAECEPFHEVFLLHASKCE